MSTFIMCGHQYTSPAGPSLTNPNTEFDEEHNVFQKPALCQKCDLTHFSNRQKLIQQTATTQEREAFDQLVEEVAEINNEKDREEIVRTKKALIQSDIRLKQDTDILLLWGNYVQVWQHSVRIGNSGKEILVIDLLRDSAGVSVQQTWGKLDGTAVQKLIVATSKAQPQGTGTNGPHKR